jgi:integrase
MYKVMVRDFDGQWLPFKTFENKAEARAYEGKLLQEREKGLKASGTRTRDLTLSGYWITWAAECRTETGEGWKKKQDQMFRDHIEPVLGKLKLIEITKAQIGLLMAAVKKKGLGPQTRLHIYNLIHKIFHDAIEVHEHREANPVRERFKPSLPVVERPYYKQDQALNWLDTVRDDLLGPALWIMTLCGLRCAEVQTLQIGDFHLDEEDPYILLQRQWVRSEGRLGPLKNKRPVRIPMPATLVEYLREKLPADAQPTDWLFKGRYNGSMISHSSIYKAVVRLTTAFGKKLSPHELRHTCSEIWVADGATMKDLQALFNHSSEASTRHYDHKPDERLTRISAQVGTRRPARSLAVVK